MKIKEIRKREGKAKKNKIMRIKERRKNQIKKELKQFWQDNLQVQKKVRKTVSKKKN